MNAPHVPVRGLAPNSDRSSNNIRVMIVDDSLTVRTIFKRMVESMPRLHVACTASSAEQAINLLRAASETNPIDVILLDLEMPGMGGIEALPLILDAAKTAQVLVVSALTDDGAAETLQALSMGAADTMLKPPPGGFNDEYRTQLLGKIRALSKLFAEHDPKCADCNNHRELGSEYTAIATFRPEVIAIGASTGGIHALNIILRALPQQFRLPILITQHLPASFIALFARQIETSCGRPTVIAEDGTPVRPGEVVVATGHSHMIIRREHGHLICRASTEPVRSGCMPSVDPMLSSLAEVCDGKALAVMLSGMGRDGADGARILVEKGGKILAQDAETSAVWGMPGAVAKAGIASLIAPPEALANAMIAQASFSLVR